MLNRHIIDQIPRLGIVSAVQNQIHRLISIQPGKLLQVSSVHIHDACFHGDRRIDLLQSPRRGHRLGRALPGIGLVKQHLPLQIGQRDNIAIGNLQKSDAGARQQFRNRASQRPATHQQNARLSKAGLPLGPDLRQQCLAVISHGQFNARKCRLPG